MPQISSRDSVRAFSAANTFRKSVELSSLSQRARQIVAAFDYFVASRGVHGCSEGEMPIPLMYGELLFGRTGTDRTETDQTQADQNGKAQWWDSETPDSLPFPSTVPSAVPSGAPLNVEDPKERSHFEPLEDTAVQFAVSVGVLMIRDRKAA